MLNKRIVLLGSALGEWLEPVRVVGDAILGSPLFHASGYGIGYLSVESGTIVHDIYHFFIDVFGQILVHFLAVEDFLTEITGRSLCGGFYVEWLLLESLTDNLKS